MAKQNSISLCMIVKNEEEFLAQCLESVKDVVDEKIIVDTGSTDRTVEIAKSYGAHIYYFDWNGSFSEARNYGLQFATCKWVLQLDADEVLERKDIPLLKSLIKTKEYNAVFLALLNETKEGWAKHYFQRLFRRGKAHFEGIVHNQLVYSGKHLVSEIRIYHYGYNLSSDKMKTKYKRTEALLLKQLEGNKSNSFAWRNYVRILRSQKRYQDVVRQAERAFTLCSKTMSDVNRQLIAYDLVYSLTQIERFKDAEKIANDYLYRFTDNYDLRFTLGISLMGQKKYREAISTFHHFIQMKESGIEIHPQIICDTYTLQHKAYALIADALVELKEYKNAQKEIEKAIELAPGLAAYRLSLARILDSLGDSADGRTAIADAIQSLSVDENFFIKWSSLCRAYPGLGTPFQALRKGIAHLPDSANLFNHAAYCIHESQSDQAVELWKRALMLNPEHIGAMTGLVKVYFARGDFERLERYAKKIPQISTTAPILKDVAHFCSLAKRYELAITLLSHYLESRPDDLLVLSKLSYYYALNGQMDSALFGVHQVLQQKPKDPAIVKNLNRVQQLISSTESVDK